jgi:hypothetical protein
MADTGQFHIRGRLWIHEPADLFDYVAAYWDDAGQSHASPGQVRIYGTGETALVSTFGVVVTHTYRLPNLPVDVIAMIEHRCGRVQFFRDSRGNAYHGVYTPTDTSWRRINIAGDVSLVVTEITAAQPGSGHAMAM